MDKDQNIFVSSYNESDLKDCFISIKNDSLLLKIYQCKQEYNHNSKIKCNEKPNEYMTEDYLDSRLLHVFDLCECKILKYLQKEDIDRFVYMKTL